MRLRNYITMGMLAFTGCAGSLSLHDNDYSGMVDIDGDGDAEWATLDCTQIKDGSWDLDFRVVENGMNYPHPSNRYFMRVPFFPEKIYFEDMDGDKVRDLVIEGKEGSKKKRYMSRQNEDRSFNLFDDITPR